MTTFLIDEDMPRSTAAVLSARGYEVLDVRDSGLRGKTDPEVLEFARTKRAVLLSGDAGFGNLVRFPLATHCGIVIARFPNEVSTKELNRQVDKALQGLTEPDFRQSLIILQPGRIRIRRMPASGRP